MGQYDLQGSLDLLVLKTLLQRGQRHGYGIAQHTQRASLELLRVGEGSLCPALHRMEQSGWVEAEWRVPETGRRAKYYRLLAGGRKRFAQPQGEFAELVRGARAVMRYA